LRLEVNTWILTVSVAMAFARKLRRPGGGGWLFLDPGSSMQTP
jgi:hypothetical protein